MNREELDALADRIAMSAATIDAATCDLLRQIREFDEVGGWHTMGAVSCAGWLSWRIGLSPGAARERVRVARALGGLPQMEAALGAGEISYSKVRAMTRVATPENEEALLSMAKASTGGQLERICRFYRTAKLPDVESVADEERKRWVSSRSTDDGMVRVTIQLCPDEAALLMKAISVSADACDGDQADGVMALANDRLGGDGASSSRPAVEATVVIDASTLEGTLENGNGVPAEMSRRLLCDSSLIGVLRDGLGDVLDVGRKTRAIPAAMRRALEVRDETCCQFPGCENRRYLDAHHLEHWIDQGETKLSNLTLLCRRHHRYVHEYGFEVHGGGGAVTFLDRDGQAIVPRLPPSASITGALGKLKAENSQRGVEVVCETNHSSWDGEPANYELCVAALGKLRAPRSSGSRDAVGRK